MATSPVPKTIPVKSLLKASTKHHAHPLVMRGGRLYIRTRADTGIAVLTPLSGEDAARQSLRESSRTHLGRMYGR